MLVIGWPIKLADGEDPDGSPVNSRYHGVELPTFQFAQPGQPLGVGCPLVLACCQTLTNGLCRASGYVLNLDQCGEPMGGRWSYPRYLIADLGF